jgi:hypothetical protein
MGEDARKPPPLGGGDEKEKHKSENEMGKMK